MAQVSTAPRAGDQCDPTDDGTPHRFLVLLRVLAWLRFGKEWCMRDTYFTDLGLIAVALLIMLLGAGVFKFIDWTFTPNDPYLECISSARSTASIDVLNATLKYCSEKYLTK